MLLDMYYKLQYYTAFLSALTIDGQEGLRSISVPEYRSMDGTARTAVGVGYYASVGGNTYYHYGLYGMRDIHSLPEQLIASQLVAVKSNYNRRASFIHIGSGTTPPTKSDYQMESEIFENIAFVDLTSKYDLNDGVVEWIATLRNDSQNTITVSEVGWSVGTPTGCSNGNIYNHKVLVYREVYASPLVVGAGETFTVNIKLQLPYAPG